MDNNELRELIEEIDTTALEQYKNKSMGEYKINIDAHSVQFDYSWIDKIEETFPYLDPIIRVPKKFLAQEEEVVPVERAKKISMETIKHLAQHTNLIQEVSDDGKITPSKVLNIFKEETFELYENRFINSLLRNLYNFVQLRKKAVSEGSFSKSEKILNYNSETKVDSEKVNITLAIKSNAYEDSSGKNSSGLTYEERISKIEFILMDYMKSPLIQSLTQALPVRSPIRKTNTILKNPNFQKALELWEFIERYDHKDRKEKEDHFSVESNKEVENKLILASYLNYDILSSMSLERRGKQKDKDGKYYIRKVVEDFINENNDMTSADFKQILAKAFSMYKQKKQQRLNAISKEFDRCVKKHQNNMKLGVSLLKNSSK